MPTYTSALLPNTSGLALGSSALRWTAYLQDVNIAGTITAGGVTGSLVPAGSSGALQFNSSGVFGATNGTFFDNTNATLVMQGNLYIGYDSSYTPATWLNLNPQLEIHGNALHIGNLLDCYSYGNKTIFSVGQSNMTGNMSGATQHNAIILGSTDSRPAGTPSASVSGAVLWGDVSPNSLTEENIQVYNRETGGSQTWKNVLMSTRAANVGSLQVATTGTTIKQIQLFTSVAVDPGSIAATSRGSIAVTVAGSPGIATGDVIIPVQGVTNINDDLIFEGVTATGANQVTFFFYNPTVGAIDDTSHNWDILWMDVT